MSRTPEIIVLKSRVTLRNRIYIAGGISGLIAWGSFQNGMIGQGLVLTGISGLLIWIGTKIKTTKRKIGEQGIYI